MHWNDPARPRLANGRPCWCTAPTWAVPGLYARPGEDDDWFLEVMLAGTWATTWVKEETLLHALQNWAEDPENTTRWLFGREPPGPGSGQEEQQATGVSVESLGL